MQRSGLYLSGLEAGYVRKNHRRSHWRGAIQRGYAGKRIAAGLLAAMMVFGTGNKIAKAVRFLNSDLSSPGYIAAASPAVQRLSAPGTLLSQEEKNEAVCPEGTIWTEKERKDTLIVLDPGHGGEDEGCARSGTQEKEINLSIAMDVQIKLQELGYQVHMTRGSDLAVALEDRVKLSGEAHADAYISIHQNSSEVSQAEGIEVWYSENHAAEDSERLSKLIEKFAVQDTGAQKREIRKEEGLYVIRECTMPSCLVETGFLTNGAERRRLLDKQYQEQLAEGIARGIDLFFHPKTMYLTFDDGPSQENTCAVLDVLKERGIHATFFVVGENVKKHPEVARRIVEEGHTIGIHCNSHVYETLYESAESYLADFEEARSIVKEVTGVETKLFRFPGGSINAYNKAVYEEIAAEMAERGYIYFDWNASLEDAVAKADPDTLVQNAVSSTLGRRHVVMLAHDVVYSTTLCLADIIDAFPEYEMKPLTEEIAPVQF